MNWIDVLSPFIKSKEGKVFKKFIKHLQDVSVRSILIPEREQIYKALEVTPFEDIKVVFVGNSPNSDALSLSDDITITLFAYLKRQYNIVNYPQNNLIKWAEQGALILNRHLTLPQQTSQSFQWGAFTDYIISRIADHHNNIIFVLCCPSVYRLTSIINSHIHNHKIILIDPDRRIDDNFRFFNEIDDFLINIGKQPIDWQI